MGQLIPGGWTLEQSSALEKHIVAGLSYAQAAREINARFSTSYSRNATMARARRVGLASIARENKPKRVRIVRANSNSNKLRVIDTSWPLQGEPLRCVEIIPRNISLMDLEPNDCRYPYGEGPFLFCGHPQQPESSYCAAHHSLTRGRKSPELSEGERERRRTRILRMNAARSNNNFAFGGD